MKEIEIQASCTKETSVTHEMLASSVGSGSVDVYATPMMIALMEKAASQLLVPYLDEGETSVGIRMDATHDAATPEGNRTSGCNSTYDGQRDRSGHWRRPPQGHLQHYCKR